MTVLEFPWVFPYRPDGGGAMAPLLPVRLQIADYQSDFLALVDTGATRTLLEGVHVRAAGLDLFAGKPLTFQGFLGGQTVAYVHRARLLIGDIELETEIAFSTQPLARQVLGRDVLACFSLGVREMALELYLNPQAI